jgi:hypothetical protein
MVLHLWLESLDPFKEKGRYKSPKRKFIIARMLVGGHLSPRDYQEYIGPSKVGYH